MNLYDDSSCPKIENAAPYVLGVLTKEEAESYQQHLDNCLVCGEEVTCFQKVANALAREVPQEKAPSALKERIMKKIHAEAKLIEDAVAASKSEL